MKYYIVIGHKKGEEGNTADGDWIEIIERNDPYCEKEPPLGAHALFGYLDVNFKEGYQYGRRASKTQEAWLIGRHRIARMLDFGNLGYQFVRRDEDTKRIQFPDKITFSFDKKIKDNGVDRPINDGNRVDIELTNLNEQIINCYDRVCDIDPIVFKLTKFDNYGDAYIDLQNADNYKEFILNFSHFEKFMLNYPSSNLYFVCKSTIGSHHYSLYESNPCGSEELAIKERLKGAIKEKHLTNYLEFCDAGFQRRSPLGKAQSGTPSSEYDTFSETMDEFFNENTFNEAKFYNVSFKKAKITINNNWPQYARSKEFKKFLEHNPDITLEIAGDVVATVVLAFVVENKIKATICLSNDLDNQSLKQAVSDNRKDDLQKIINDKYDNPTFTPVVEQDNEEYRLTLEKYLPQKLHVNSAVNQNVDMKVGQNKNLNQNQNQRQQMSKNNDEAYEPIKLEINNKSSIPDVNFASQAPLLESLIGLAFENPEKNAPQTETNINALLGVMEKIIQGSPASQHCYCPLSYSVGELVPGAFYVPKEKVKSIPHPRHNHYAVNAKDSYTFDKEKNTLFFSPPYASIAIKQNKYVFKPYHRPIDTSDCDLSLNVRIDSNDAMTSLREDYILEYASNYALNLNDGLQQVLPEQKISQLLNKLYLKRGQAGIDLLTKSFSALKLKNRAVYQTLMQHLLTSNDFSEYVDDPRYIDVFDKLLNLTDQKKINWWNHLLTIQCKSNPNFDLSHLFKQLTGFWDDMDKLQKFIIIPDTFPFDGFADAGVTLGKMIRIMSKARNRFEQIRSFEGGNISHAYMLFDLFNSSMYCKDMDLYCASLVKTLKAENAFDKSQLKATHFSTQKLVELANDPSISLEELKSYLFIFAAVNGNTEKHNHSDLAFYHALFEAIEQAISEQSYSNDEKKVLYSTIMLFAALGNNKTKDRMAQDITAFTSNSNKEHCLAVCQRILAIYTNKAVSNFFSVDANHGKMTHSDVMPSFHTISTLYSKYLSCDYIIKQSTDLIIKNKSVSLALQKVMRDKPDCLSFIDLLLNPIDIKGDDKKGLNQSIYIIVAALSQNKNGDKSWPSFYLFETALKFFNVTSLTYLNQLLLDIDFNKLPKNTDLFSGKNLSESFCSKAKNVQNLDDMIFLFRSYGIEPATIKPSEQGLVKQISQLENDWSFETKKKQYVASYQDLISIRLQIILDGHDSIGVFNDSFVRKIDENFPSASLKMSYGALIQIIDTTKKDNLLDLLSILQQFPIGAHAEREVDPSLLLNATASLLKHIQPERVVTLLQIIQKNSAHDVNAKLLYVQHIFDKVTREEACYETRNRKKKMTKETTNQINACMTLMKTIKQIDHSQWDLLLRRGTLLTTQQHLQLLEALASPTNLSHDLVNNQFAQINRTMFDILQKYPGGFSDLLDIIKFDVELINTRHFRDRAELSLVAKICKNEALLNSRKHEKLAENYKQVFAENITTLINKKLDLNQFYHESQLAHPSADVLVRLLKHYANNVDKALHHYEKDPWFKRPHKKKDINEKNLVHNKESAYETGAFDMSQQNAVLDQITADYPPFEKSVRRNLLVTLSTYMNEKGYRLPAMTHTNAGGKSIKVPVRKLSDVALKDALTRVKNELKQLKNSGQNNIWQHQKYQRAVCDLLAITREAMYRYEDKTAYSTQMDAIFLALLAGDYQYAMQINTGEGKAIIATAIAMALQIITDKQIVITTSNLSLAFRDAGAYHELIQWFGIKHTAISATTKDKNNKLRAQIIHSTNNDFALFHGQETSIDNSNKIYVSDEMDHTKLHLMPSINSQSKFDEEDNWWIYEEILDYVTDMIKAEDGAEAKIKPQQQTRALINKLRTKFDEELRKIEKDRVLRLHEVNQNGELSVEAQIGAKEVIDKDCDERTEFYAKRIRKLDELNTEKQFNAFIDSAIIAQFVLNRGEAYEVIDQFEDGKTLKKVVPTEGGKPITEGDVMYMYGIHQFLILKTIREFEKDNAPSEFIKPSELESTTYFNNHAIQAGTKLIGITGTVPDQKYQIYKAFMSGGKSNVIPSHRDSRRIDVVPSSKFNEIKQGNEHVCDTEAQLIQRLIHKIKAHDGPALVYCRHKNSCEERHNALIAELKDAGYTVQMVIAGVTEDFTDGDKLTELGRQAQHSKTVTLTVGDGRGIDLKPDGKDGLLTVCSFVPENAEKISQIYGRSGRNGELGKTDLLVLNSELTNYGLTFENLEKEFEFMDELRHKEFDFAIQKVGFMQYEIQKQISDEKKIDMIAYMDDLYNRLLLKAVADKVKNKTSNTIRGQHISGRWEPFVMLKDDELDRIYQEFCNACQDKLHAMHVYNIHVNQIKNLQRQYGQQAERVIEQEKIDQASLKSAYVRDRIEHHVQKRRYFLEQNEIRLDNSLDVDISAEPIRSVYQQFALNLSRYDKTVSMMQKQVGSHLGLYGFIKDNNSSAYKQLYKILEDQKQIIRQYKKQETDVFYKHLIYGKCLEVITLLNSDNNFGSKRNQVAVETCLQDAIRIIHMAGIDIKINTNSQVYTFESFRKAVRNYYTQGDVDYELICYLPKHLEQKVKESETQIKHRKEAILTRCQDIFQTLQNKIYKQSTAPLRELTQKPLKEIDSKSATLFSLLQLGTKEERNTEPVKRIINEISKEVNPSIEAYNQQVNQFRKVLNQQLVCFDYLQQPHQIRTKINQYEEMVNFNDIASKNLVVFYDDYNRLPETIRALSEDIKREEQHLAILRNKISVEVNPRIQVYNQLIKRFKMILTQQRECFKSLRRPHQIEKKINKYNEVVHVVDYSKLPETIRALSEDIKREESQLARLKKEVSDQEEMKRRTQYISDVNHKISGALKRLRSNVSEINHPLAEAKDVANRLFDALQQQQEVYLTRLNQVLLEELAITHTDFKQHTCVIGVNESYMRACETLINDVDTRRVLERDLDWGVYLSNLLKSLANIVIAVGSFGTVNNFFKLTKSETLFVIDESRDSLSPVAVGA